MNFEIKNCNNIDSATIELHQNKLNIKFAPNGTGKSTIARAVLLASKNDPKLLAELLPFKLRKQNPNNVKPEFKSTLFLSNVMCFNEEYVKQFLFKPESVQSNSFDIYVRTDTYKQREQEIEELVLTIKKLFSGNQELDALISTLTEMSNAFKLSKTGLDKKSTGMKGLADGNKIMHVPSGLESYTAFIQSQKSVEWIDWQTKGYGFIELSDNCPFCTADSVERQETIRKVGQEYDKNTIKNLIALLGMIEKLGDFFSIDAKERLEKITTLKEGLKQEHEDALATIKKQIDGFIDNLQHLKNLSTFQFEENEKVSEKLKSYKLDLQFFSELNSPKMREAIAPINTSIDSLIAQAGILQGKINQQRNEMYRTVERHQRNINEFLSYAGIRYIVEIAGEGENAQLKFRHIDLVDHLNGGDQHLSFGERNAFAIVLFMHECLSKKPDLVILDDPISSFDKNKKYAILQMLFRREAKECLLGKTVLMLTHDVEPIIDTVKSVHKEFSNQTAVSFLSIRTGTITEKAITKNDIQTFAEICSMALRSDKDLNIKLIYLRRRCEISDDRGDAYQVLSNLFHGGNGCSRGLDKREPINDAGIYPEMAIDKFENGCTSIENEVAGFNYQNCLDYFQDKARLKALYATLCNGYEKLQVARLLGIKDEHSVVRKFINETYHIENEFICQLDPARFDTIPEYIVTACDEIVSGN